MRVLRKNLATAAERRLRESAVRERNWQISRGSSVHRVVAVFETGARKLSGSVAASSRKTGLAAASGQTSDAGNE